jgi:hypothetical protein
VRGAYLTWQAVLTWQRARDPCVQCIERGKSADCTWGRGDKCNQCPARRIRCGTHPISNKTPVKNKKQRTAYARKKPMDTSPVKEEELDELDSSEELTVGSAGKDQGPDLDGAELFELKEVVEEAVGMLRKVANILTRVDRRLGEQLRSDLRTTKRKRTGN